MHFSTALVAVAAIAPFVTAHEGPGSGVPKIIGLNMRDLKARSMLGNLVGRAQAAEVDHHEAHEKRQGGNAEGQCGDGIGTCAAGYCCSESGWCGNTAAYCYSPGCNYKYGPGCPENVTPAGTNTSTVARTQLGSVAYGGNGIYECVTPGTVAITYDDGPLANYTDHILDIFKSYNAKATFFITGNNINKGEIDTTASHVASIKRMAADGHHIASHTWTHLDLSAITTADRHDQMIKNEMAIRNILGYFPTYMRPPYSSCTAASGCEADLAALGYHVTYFNVDTDDYNNDAPNLIQNAKNNYLGNITAAGATAANSEWLVIGHDIHAQTAYNLTDYMLSTLTTLGYKAVTVGECLGDPATNWYRTSAASGSVSSSVGATTLATSTRASTIAGTSTSASTVVGTSTRTSTAASASASTKVSTDGTCGGTTGFTCLNTAFGNCCSSAGWCGSTTDYCGTGCQAGFGTCTSTSSSAVAVSVKTSSTVVVSTKASSTVVVTTKASSAVVVTTKASSAVVVTTKASSAVVVTTKASSTAVVVTSTKTSSSAAATATKKVSTDGTCAGTSSFTCQGSSFGNCCSSAGWCGSTTAYCGTGCQNTFGTCT